MNIAAMNMGGADISFDIVTSFPSDIYPEVELLDLMVALFFIFKGTSILFSIMSVPIYIPTNSAQGFPFLHILANLTSLVFLIGTILRGMR